MLRSLQGRPRPIDCACTRAAFASVNVWHFYLRSSDLVSAFSEEILARLIALRNLVFVLGRLKDTSVFMGCAVKLSDVFCKFHLLFIKFLFNMIKDNLGETVNRSEITSGL